LGICQKYTINYTSQLPIDKGFKAIQFDELEDYYSNDGKEHRGYLLEIKEVDSGDIIDEIAPLDEFNGTILYRCEPIRQFNRYTNIAKQLKPEDSFIVGSKQFAIAGKIADGDIIRVKVNGFEFETLFKIDNSLKGTIALSPTFNSEVCRDVFLSNYRYIQAKIEKVGS